MREFTDAMGRKWNVELTLGSSLRLKTYAGLTLDDFIPKADAKNETDFAAFQEFASDVFKIFDVLYALVKPQADAQGLSKEQVMEAIGDREADVMVETVLSEIVDFFRKRDPRRAMLVAKTFRLNDQLATKAAARLEKLELLDFVANVPEPTDDELMTLVREQLSKSVGTSPATSA